MGPRGDSAPLGAKSSSVLGGGEYDTQGRAKSTRLTELVLLRESAVPEPSSSDEDSSTSIVQALERKARHYTSD